MNEKETLIDRVINQKGKEIINEMINWTKLTGQKFYLVGGTIRDILLGRPTTKDLDFVIESPNGPFDFIEYITSLTSGEDDSISKFIIKHRVDFKDVGVSKLNIIGPLLADSPACIDVEISMTRKEFYAASSRRPDKVEYADIHEDAFRRDFCCNAVYFDLLNKKLIDPTNKGLHDIEKKLLRTTKDPKLSFKEDPLRMLRCLRFSITLKLQIDPTTDKAITYNSEYSKLSLSLIKPEFEKSLIKGMSKYIIRLHESGLLGHIIPELEEAWGFNLNCPYYSMTLSDHLLSTLDWALSSRNLIGEGSFGLGGSSVVLAYASLLHDISKYKYYKLDYSNYFTYLNHEESSALIAKSILQRLEYHKVIINNIVTVIRNHGHLNHYWSSETKTPIGEPERWRLSLNLLTGSVGQALLMTTLILIDANYNTRAPEHCRPGLVKRILDVGFDRVTVYKNLPKITEIIDRFDLKSNVLNYKRTAAKIRSAMNDILPLQTESHRLTSEDIFCIYSGVFSDVLYVIRTKKTTAANQTCFDYIISPSAPIIPEHPTDVVENDSVTVNILEKDIKDEIDILINKQKEAEGKAKEDCQDDSSIDIIAIESKYYPDLLMRLKVRQEAFKILSNIHDNMQKLRNLPGYSSAAISDKGELFYTIDFHNQERITIF